MSFALLLLALPALLALLALGGCRGPEGVGPVGPASRDVLEGFGQPRALALDGHGLLYVVDGRSGRVACVMADGQRLWLDAAQGVPAAVSAVALDGRGRVVVVDPAAGEVVRLEPEGGRRVLAHGLAEPVALVCDRDGGLLVACRGDGTVRRIASR